jgi:hypothetical protein
MGCGCKKKRINPATQPQTVNKIIIVEGEVKAAPPEVLRAPPPPPPESDVDHIVDKLNNILKPT